MESSAIQCEASTHRILTQAQLVARDTSSPETRVQHSCRVVAVPSWCLLAPPLQTCSP